MGEETIKDIHVLLNQDNIPDHNHDCDYCKYVLANKSIE